MLLIRILKYLTSRNTWRNSQQVAMRNLDSAAGGLKETKAPNQAVLPLRGKILNTASKDLADIIKSKVIADLLTTLGCGIGDNFNIKNLRYKRILVETDSDPDKANASVRTYLYR